MFKTFALIVVCTTLPQPIAAFQAARSTAVTARPRIGIDPIADYVIPIVRDGGGYQTSFFLSNRDSKTLHLGVYFLATDGTMLTLPVQDSGFVVAVPIDLDVNQSATFQTTGESNTAVDGYALVFNFDRPASDPEAKPDEGLFSGQATFMKSMNGVAVEALAPLSSGVETASAVAFD